MSLPYSDIVFLWPWMGLFFLLSFFYQEKRQDMFALRIPFLKDIKAAALPSRYSLSFLKYLIALFLSFALMRPVTFDFFAERPFSGRSIMLTIDVSGSMQEQDVAFGSLYLSRMDAVQRVVSDFIKDRTGDLIGISLFGSRGYLYVPLTYDLSSAEKMMCEVDVGLAGQRTAVGDGIGVALRAMENWEQKDKVLVLLSDGVENAGTLTASKAAEIAKEKKVRIYAVGLGHPASSEDGFDETLLRRIAKDTGGKYFNASDMKGLQRIYDEIDRLEPSIAVTRQMKIQKELFFYPLAAAVLLILWGIRRRRI